MTATSSPRAISRSRRWEPMKPAPPVRRIFMGSARRELALEEGEERDVRESREEQHLERDRAVHFMTERVVDHPAEAEADRQLDQRQELLQRHLVLLADEAVLVRLERILRRPHELAASGEE